MNGEKIVIGHTEAYDCTLREARQAMGVNFQAGAAAEIAGWLDNYGVDFIEVGWPGAWKMWDQLFELIAGGKLKTAHAQFAAFGSTRRANKTVDSDSLFRQVVSAPVSIITLFGKAWDVHVSEVLRTTRENNLAMVAESVAEVCRLGKHCFFDAEHFFQGFLYGDAEYALQVAQAAANAGAERIILCDTNGIAYPWQIADVISQVKAALGAQAVVGVHMHGDRGMDSANTLAALVGGAGHFQGTVNGYAERVHMTCTVEVLSNLWLMGQGMMTACPQIAVNPNLRHELAKKVSNEVDAWAGLHPNHRKPFVGRAACTHKAGVHGAAVRRNPTLYESHPPEMFGRRRHLVVSSMAGKANIIAFTRKAWGVILPEKDPRIVAILRQVEEREAKSYCLDSASGSAMLLVARHLWPRAPRLKRQLAYEVTPSPGERGLAGEQAAVVRFEDNRVSAAIGDGPVDAIFRALIDELSRQHTCLAELVLTDYTPYTLRVKGLEGTAKKMRVEIDWEHRQFGKFTTQGISNNIIHASWEAILEAVELIFVMQWRQEQQRVDVKVED